MERRSTFGIFEVGVTFVREEEFKNFFLDRLHFDKIMERSLPYVVSHIRGSSCQQYLLYQLLVFATFFGNDVQNCFVIVVSAHSRKKNSKQKKSNKYFFSTFSPFVGIFLFEEEREDMFVASLHYFINIHFLRHF